MTKITNYRRTRSLLSLVLYFLLAVSCLSSPQKHVQYEAVFIPTTPRNFLIGNWSITLYHADVAFGPIYFCAAASGSSTLCQTANAEIRTVTTLNVLASEPISLGQVEGLTVHIGSASYDFGLSWVQTQATPKSNSELGHSVVLAGEASRGDRRIQFKATVDIVPQFPGQMAIPSAQASAEIADDAVHLEVSFDVPSWLSQLDFDAPEWTDQSLVVIRPGSQEHNAIVTGIKVLGLAQLKWVGGMK